MMSVDPITVTEGVPPDICPQCLTRRRGYREICASCERGAAPSDGELLNIVAGLFGETAASVRRDADKWLWIRERFSRACPVAK